MTGIDPEDLYCPPKAQISHWGTLVSNSGGAWPLQWWTLDRSMPWVPWVLNIRDWMLDKLPENSYQISNIGF